jgi:transcriptional regulator with XRE-family HTH domain
MTESFQNCKQEPFETHERFQVKMATVKNTRAGLGNHLRKLRKGNGWTLDQVSAMTGLATSTLSKVENNQTSLTYDNLLKLAEGLDVNVGELFASEESRSINGRRTVTRNGDAKIQTTPNYDYHYHATDLLDMRMIPIIVDLKAHSIEQFGDLLSHSGEEFIYVLEGAIEVHTEFYGPVRLEVGESIYLDSTMGHGYISVGDGDAKILGVCSGPIPDDLGLPVDPAADG